MAGRSLLLLAVIETFLASMNIMRHGLTIKPKTIVVNVYFAGILGLFSDKGGGALFLDRRELDPAAESKFTEFRLAAGGDVAVAFPANSILVAFFTSLKKELSFWKVWADNCLNGLVIYLMGGVVAGIIVKALEQDQRISVCGGRRVLWRDLSDVPTVR